MAESVDALKGKAWRCGCLWRKVWLVLAGSRAMVDRGARKWEAWADDVGGM